MTVTRRAVVQRMLGAGVVVAVAPSPIANAQSAAPMRIGLVTVKTGPVASGGLQMEEGLTLYLKERDNRLAGRPVELFSVDTAATPAIARSKVQELVELNRVSCLIGPLAANEALACDDYIRQVGIPTLSVAAAEDMTQRHPNPWFVRATSSSAQCSYPMADYAIKELGYRRVATIGEDNAYGQEQVGGFHRLFEDLGGKVVQKLWPPLTVPDYGTYIAQIKPDIDALYVALAGSNPFRFFRQFNEYGLGQRLKLLGGMTAVDESILRNMGDEAIGLISTCWYSAQLDNPSNAKLVAEMRQDYKIDPGFYAAATYTNAAVLEAALKTINARIEDKQALMNALRTNAVPETARGPVRFDSYGNVYIRRVEKKDGRLVNTVIKTYPDVSQFWTYDPAAFLKDPVYSRDVPLARNLEP